uniref:Coiled-coil domain containing 137 n=1 Tax=Mandrillus leucophaeus TaxID=9568 RepID=A0A2K5ZIB1_MANLE
MEEGRSGFTREAFSMEMAQAGGGAAVPRVPVGPGSPRRVQRRHQGQPLGKQRPVPWSRLRSKEKKVNRTPKNQDEEEIPFWLGEIMGSCQKMKNPIGNKKRKKAAQVAFRKTLEKEAKGVEPDIAIPKFKQRKGDKKKAFQKRRLDKVRQKKEEKMADRLEQELLRDTMKFGEVVLQPPELTTRPGRSISKNQPGRRSQMLRMLLSPGGVSQPLTASLAYQWIRWEAVQAYRALKQRLLQGERPHLTSRKKPEPQL